MTRDGETYCYIAYAHVDPVALTDDSGHVINEHEYDPYGNRVSVPETVENPYRYAGYRVDEATGLYYCWNRYCDPGTYRFITRDIYPGELESPATMNAYAYCLVNPVAWVDPSGMFAFGAGVVIGGHAFGIGGSLSISIVGDDHGNIGLAITKGYQGGAVPAATLAVQLQPTGANTICDLEGVSGAGGGSVGPIGAEAWTAQSGDGSYYGGANVQLGLTESAYGVPYEAHGSLDRTDVYGFNLGDLFGL